MIIEFLTAATHHVLYHRGVYPRELFETRALYGSRVMRCRHPEVVSYVENAIGALRRPIARGDVKRVVVVVKDGETRGGGDVGGGGGGGGGSGGRGLPVERHTFDFALNARRSDRPPTRRDVDALQKGLCATLSKIAFSDVTLPPLPRGASACAFEIVAYAGRSGIAEELGSGEWSEERVDDGAGGGGGGGGDDDEVLKERRSPRERGRTGTSHDGGGGGGDRGGGGGGERDAVVGEMDPALEFPRDGDVREVYPVKSVRSNDLMSLDVFVERRREAS